MSIWFEYSFPSPDLFKFTSKWVERSRVLGRLERYILPKPYINKLKNIRERELDSKIRELTLPLRVGRSVLRIITSLENIEVINQICNQVEGSLVILGNEIAKFVEGKEPDVNFMKAYRAKGGVLNLEKWIRDQKLFKRTLIEVAKDLQSREKYKEKSIEEIIEETKQLIIMRADELPNRFRYGFLSIIL